LRPRSSAARRQYIRGRRWNGGRPTSRSPCRRRHAPASNGAREPSRLTFRRA